MARIYRDWLEAYMGYTQASEAPDAFHFWTGVSTIAAVLQRRVWIPMLHFTFTPNFYIIFVAPPGIATKSTTIRIGGALLKKVPGVFLGPQSVTWQALGESLQEALTSVKIGKENYIMSCITCTISELGTFLKPQDRDLMSVLTDMWDGADEKWTHRTVYKGKLEVHTPWINIIGATTPAWLKDNFPEVMIGGGLTSRVVFVYADRKRRLMAYPTEHANLAEHQKTKFSLIADLKEMHKLKGPYKLTPEALEWGTEWYGRHWTARDIDQASDRYEGYQSRKQAHVHKLAIVLAASQRNTLEIELEDLVTAELKLKEVEGDMSKVFASIGASITSKNVTAMMAFVQTYKKLPFKQLFRFCFPVMSLRDFDEAIDAAQRAGFITLTSEDGKKFVIYKGKDKK